MTDEVEAVARAICCPGGCSSIATYADTSGCGCSQWRGEAEVAIAAITAIGWQKVPKGSVVVSFGNACSRYPYCGCKPGLMSLVACQDAARPDAGKGE